MKLKNGIEIVSMVALGGRGSVRMRNPLFAAGIRADEQLGENLKAAGAASMFFDMKGQQKQDNFNYGEIGDVLPKDGDYITVPFRAISKRFVPGHCLDFTKDNVLKDSVELLRGATVYPNHDLFDINNALGVVADVSWDEEGKSSDGVAGINAEYKIDALMNPRIARLLLMKPPAIHSTSMTVLFDFECSHPNLVEEKRFWNLLGEEVEGEIVRMIVTEITEYWEASLVFMGADRLAKQASDDEDGEYESFSAKGTPLADAAAGAPQAEPAADDPPPNSNEEKTMKLTVEKKAELGIEFDGDDVPETEILKAAESLAGELAKVDQVNIAELTTRAEAGDKYVELQRTEVTRLATIAELGAEDGELPAVISKQLASADLDTLVELQEYYGQKVAERFPNGRSSKEGSELIDAAAGDETDAQLSQGEDLTGGLFS